MLRRDRGLCSNGRNTGIKLTHRPGYTPPFGEQSYYTRLTLRRLPEAQTHAMVERVLQSAEIPPPVLALMARRAEGNPLFIEELCNMLREDGTLQQVDGAYRLAHPLDEAAIPATIQGVITARIDRLPEAAKAALQVASVIGREFTARLLERVSAMEHMATQVLGELRAVELIYEKTIVPELAYMFRHALTHDVAYDSLLRQRRRELHRRAGEVIEDLYSERLAEFYETLAWHYVQGAIWPKAVAYLLKAAQKARGQYAYPEATRACMEALDILDRHGETRDTLMQAYEVLGDLQSLPGRRPLSEHESLQMAEGMLATSALPVELRDFMVQKAEGNPFVMEEVLTSLLEVGTLAQEDGRYLLRKPLAEIDIPEPIQGVIMARIDRLAESPRRALQLASVVGREFTVRLLARIADLETPLGYPLQQIQASLASTEGTYCTL